MDQAGDGQAKEAVRQMQFDSSLHRYSRARSVNRKKLGELLYRDLANCRIVITKPQT
jgi:hypothetical protein